MKSRRLCEPCYHLTKRLGTIYTYPTLSESVRNRRYVCECAKPLVVALSPWNVYQCDLCGMKIAEARYEELDL
jgi:hypothetical protein